jgi:hypothetical protein
MGGGATFTEISTPATACDPNRTASARIRTIVSLFFIFGIFLSSLFVMTPDSRLMEVCSLTLPGSRRTGFVP